MTEINKTSDIRRDKKINFTTINGLIQETGVKMTLDQFRAILKTQTPEIISGLFSRITYFGFKQKGENINILLTGVGNPVINGYTRLTDVSFAIPHGTETPWVSFRTLSNLDEITKILFKQILIPTTKINLGNNIQNFSWKQRNNEKKTEGNFYYLYENNVLPVGDVNLDTVIPVPGTKNHVLLGIGGKFHVKTLNIKTGLLTTKTTI